MTPTQANSCMEALRAKGLTLRHITNGGKCGIPIVSLTKSSGMGN